MPEGIEFGAVAVAVAAGQGGEPVAGKDTSEVVTVRRQPLKRFVMIGLAVDRIVYLEETMDLKSAAESFAGSPVVGVRT